MLERIQLLLAALAMVALACRSSAAPAAPEEADLPVLVELRLAGEARPGADRRQAIHEAARRLEGALDTADIPYQVVRRYDTIPWLALRIPGAARERLAAIPEVASVRDDRIERLP